MFRVLTSFEFFVVGRRLPTRLVQVVLNSVVPLYLRRFLFSPHVSRTGLKTAAMTNLNGVLTPPSTASPNLLQMNMAREREKYLEEYNFPFCEAATKFEKLAKIGQGTFGYVQYSFECNRNYLTSTRDLRVL